MPPPLEHARPDVPGYVAAMSDADPTRLAREVGLCARCLHARVIVNRNASRFYYCERSRSDRRFPRYPPLPVLECEGWEPSDGEEETQ